MSDTGSQNCTHECYTLDLALAELMNTVHLFATGIREIPATGKTVASIH